MPRARALPQPRVDTKPLWIALAAALALMLAACGSPERPDAAPESTANAAAGTTAAADDSSADANTITVVTADEVREAVEDGEGRITLVNFWATWCPPCVKEMPYFAEVFENYDRDRVHFLSVSADHPETVTDAVEPFLEKNPQPYPILLMDAMPEDIEAALNAPFPGNLPVTLLYDADGNIAQRWDREITLEELEEAIDGLLS